MVPSGAPEGEHRLPTWLRPSDPEHRLPVVVAIVVALACQLAVPPSLALDPHWLVPALEVVLVLLVIGLRLPVGPSDERLERVLTIATVGAITLDTVWSAVRLDTAIIAGRASAGHADHLLVTGAAVYGTTIVAFGTWYWLLDRGGPEARARGERDRPDFLFPQMGLDARLVPPGWRPQFSDYLYVAYTTVVAFSPTDTLPLTRWAKGLMTVQSALAFSTVALVLARAVNILTT